VHSLAGNKISNCQLPDKAAACAFAAGIVISKLNDSEYRWAQKKTKQNKKKERKGKRKKHKQTPERAGGDYVARQRKALYRSCI